MSSGSGCSAVKEVPQENDEMNGLWLSLPISGVVIGIGKELGGHLGKQHIWRRSWYLGILYLPRVPNCRQDEMPNNAKHTRLGQVTSSHRQVTCHFS